MHCSVIDALRQPDNDSDPINMQEGSVVYNQTLTFFYEWSLGAQYILVVNPRSLSGFVCFGYGHAPYMPSLIQFVTDVVPFCGDTRQNEQEPVRQGWTTMRSELS